MVMIVFLVNLFGRAKNEKKSSNQNLFEVTVPMKKIKEDTALRKVRSLHKFSIWIVLILSEEY